MFKSINTVGVYVTDMQKAKSFYTETLGFKLRVELGPTLCFLQSDDIHIYLESGHKPSPVDATTVRLSVFLQTEGSVHDVYDTLKESGVKLLQDEPQQVDEDVYWFQFADPDGNILEVSGRK